MRNTLWGLSKLTVSKEQLTDSVTLTQLLSDTTDGDMIPIVSLSVTVRFESDCHSVTHSSDTPTDSDIIFIQLSENSINNWFTLMTDCDAVTLISETDCENQYSSLVVLPGLYHTRYINSLSQVSGSHTHRSSNQIVNHWRNTSSFYMLFFQFLFPYINLCPSDVNQVHQTQHQVSWSIVDSYSCWIWIILIYFSLWNI